MQQSIDVLRKRNADLSNLVRDHHRRRTHGRSVSETDASTATPAVSPSHDRQFPGSSGEPSLAEQVDSSQTESTETTQREAAPARQHQRGEQQHEHQTQAHWEEPWTEGGEVGASDGVVDTEIDTLLCPITQEEFEDPVVAADGHTYERAGILQWLEKHDTSPLTGAQLSSKQLFTNWTLRSVVADYKKRLLDKLQQSTSSQAAETTAAGTAAVETTQSSNSDPPSSGGAEKDGDGNEAQASMWVAAASAARSAAQGSSTTSPSVVFNAESELAGSQTCVIS